MSYGHVHQRRGLPPPAAEPVVIEFARELNRVYQSPDYEVALVRYRRGQPYTAGTLSPQVILLGSEGRDDLFGESGGFAMLLQPEFADGESTAWMRVADLWHGDPEHGYPHFMDLRIEPGAGFEVGARGNGEVSVHLVALPPNW